jgi:hypothetical protein
MPKFTIRASQTVHKYYETDIEATSPQDAEEMALTFENWDDEKEENADEPSIDQVEEIEN